MVQSETANVTRDSAVLLIFIHFYMGKVLVKYPERMLPEIASKKKLNYILAWANQLIQVIQIMTVKVKKAKWLFSFGRSILLQKHRHTKY